MRMTFRPLAALILLSGLLTGCGGGAKQGTTAAVRSGKATFVVLFPGVPGYPGFTQKQAVLATFGKPAQTYHVGTYTILVWKPNLLTNLAPP